MSDYVIYNGELKKESELLISPLNRGMMYGDGLFDTLRSYQGKFLNLDAHFERLLSGADYLGIQVHFSYEDFKIKLIELLNANHHDNTDALIRIQCWRTGERGYATDSNQANWISSSSQIKPSNQPIKLSIVNTRSIPSEALERKFKLSNGLNYIKAAQEAKQLGSDDALILTIDGIISETTISNIFWVKDSNIFTPSVSCDLLAGITRNSLLALEDIAIHEGEFIKQDIIQADAVFTTNSIREITYVRSIDDINYDLGNKVIEKVNNAFEGYRNKQLH